MGSNRVEWGQSGSDGVKWVETGCNSVKLGEMRVKLGETG